MTTVSRTQLFNQLFEVLKRHYRPRPADASQPVLEHLMFAAVLENARYQIAERVFQALKTEFFDWNEIRVCTIRDLAEVGQGLPDPAAAATRLKCPLQHIFESSYSFDLEELRKQPIGQAVEKLQRIDGVSRFMVAYVVQNALGGHTIPLDSATLRALNILGLADESEMASGNVAGLERAIAKSKGLEFAWMLHEFSAEFWADHRAPTVLKVFKAIDPKSLDRLQAWEEGSLAPAATPAAPSATKPSAGKTPSQAVGEAAPATTAKRRGRPRKTPQPPAVAEAPAQSAAAAPTLSPAANPPVSQETAPSASSTGAAEAAGSPPRVESPSRKRAATSADVKEARKEAAPSREKKTRAKKSGASRKAAQKPSSRSAKGARRGNRPKRS